MYLKTEAQIAKMRRAGLLVWKAHQAAAALIRPGVTTAEIDAAVERVIVEGGGVPLFKGVPGKVPFPAATCISIDEEVVHGIPGPRRLAEGEIVSIDTGVKLDGWCADAAVTHPVGAVDPKVRRLLEVTEGALRLAIQSIAGSKRWRQVAREMESYVRRAGFAVVHSLVGHHIGRELWEDPQVPNYYTTDIPDFALEPGIVIAVEPMVNAGGKGVKMQPDHWTIITRDRRPSAHFEHTLAITGRGVLVLTAGPEGQGWALDRI
ncbi:MAG TPA: type I methionyl aminopeptidase [Thermoanaerobaculia bacterium]|nr:type I methionyl aminopeptidase [Thermoanaerobaculia bacterium]